MFKTAIGVTEDSSSTCYLRPETAQGIFVNFANIQRTTRRKLPFGVCQVGKAFRNEITPGNFTFRTREFEQMECEFFCKPGTDLEWFAYWKDFCKNWLISLGHQRGKPAPCATTRPPSWPSIPRHDGHRVCLPLHRLGRAVGHRRPHRLRPGPPSGGVRQGSHLLRSGGERALHPVCDRAPPLGCDRVALAFLCEAYDEEGCGTPRRTTCASCCTCIRRWPRSRLPSCRSRRRLSDKAREVYDALKSDFMVDFDDAGSIGKRYRRQDEIGTPYCITIDFDTVGDESKGQPADNCVTVRDPRHHAAGAREDRGSERLARSAREVLIAPHLNKRN